MKKFKCTVERSDEYIIEFDENIINEEYMNKYRKMFYNFTTFEEHAKNLAQFRSRFPDESFIEGYGCTLINGKDPRWNNDKSFLEKGINIRIISEDQYCNVDVEELL